MVTMTIRRPGPPTRRPSPGLQLTAPLPRLLLVLIMVLHGASHLAATTLTTNGQSQESLVGETAIKAALGGLGSLLRAVKSSKSKRA